MTEKCCKNCFYMNELIVSETKYSHVCTKLNTPIEEVKTKNIFYASDGTEVYLISGMNQDYKKFYCCHFNNGEEDALV